MVVKKRSTKAPRNPYLTAATPDELGPANRIAYDIIAQRRDLLPSVERIMNAGLDTDGTVDVLTLFCCSLTATGDPKRDREWRSPPTRRRRTRVAQLPTRDAGDPARHAAPRQHGRRPVARGVRRRHGGVRGRSHGRGARRRSPQRDDGAVRDRHPGGRNGPAVPNRLDRRGGRNARHRGVGRVPGSARLAHPPLAALRDVAVGGVEAPRRVLAARTS